MKLKGLLCISFLFFFVQKLTMHFGFHTGYWDLYFNDQSVWHITQGKGLYLGLQQKSFFSDHFYPLLYLFAPLYFLKASPVWLFLVHAVLMVVMMWPIVKLAQEKFGNKGAVLIWVMLMAYLPLRSASLQDFHGEIVMAPILAWILYFFEHKKDRQALFLTLGLLFAKETAGLLLVFIGFYYALSRKEWKMASVLVLIGLVFTVWVLKVFIPSFAVGESYAYVSRYAYLGGSLEALVKTLILKPWIPLAHLFSAQNLGYFVALSLPFAFLQMGSLYAVIGIGTLCQNMLAETSTLMSNPTTHYSIPLIPIFFVGFITVLARLRDEKSPRYRSLLKMAKGFAIFAVCLNVLLFVFLEARHFVASSPQIRSGYKALALIPKAASVSASTHYFVHLHYRGAIQLFPENPGSDYVIVQTEDPYFPTGVSTDTFIRENWAKGRKWPVVKALIMGEDIPRAENDPYQQAIQTLSKDPRYSLVFSENGVLVWRKA